MSACLELDDALPALTSRLLLLLEDEEDLLVFKPQSLTTTSSSIATRKLEETKETEESPMLVSPCIHRRKSSHQASPLWSSPRPRLDSLPELGLPSIQPLPNPSTPLSTKGLFTSFPSSPLQQDLWQYGEAREQHPSFLSPRNTDAVLEESKKAAAGSGWCKNNNSNEATGAEAARISPMAPSLLQNLDEIPASSSHSDAPPSIIHYRNRSGSYSSLSGFDDDEVSLLADDPDEDDAGVLPPATYNVVVNILDEIDRDDDQA